MSPARSRMVAALAALLVLTLGGGTAVKGADSSGADIGSALLVAEDLPAVLASAMGVTHEPAFDFDQASFDANGGLDKAAQTWQATEVVPDSPVLIVFDFRFLFPSAVAAQDYLDAAEQILSESVTGITLQAETAPVGEVLRQYAGSLAQGDVTIDVQNFLFRTGPVVAKVYIGGFGTTLDDALPIARAAAARIDAWLAEQPSAPPPASNGPEASTGPAAPSDTAAVGSDVPYVDAEGVPRGVVTVREVANPFTEHHEDYPPDEGTRYVMLSVAFEAADDQSFAADPYGILVQDADGFLWAKASVTRPPEATIPELSSQEMAPGNRISGLIGYVVPAEAQLERVLYQPESGRLITVAHLAPIDG